MPAFRVTPEIRGFRTPLTGHPDRLHLHSLVMRRVVHQHFPTMHRTLSNSLTGTIMWLMTLAPVVWAFVFYDNTSMLALAACRS